MGIVQMNNNGPGNDGLVELNKHIHDDHKKIRHEIMGEGQGLSEEDESQVNEDVEDINNGKTEVVQLQVYKQGVQRRSQQQLQGPLIRWERFLPLRSLKVLLVENDDSTRHVVCALLQNCGYEVTAVSNGLQAWKILEDLTNHIDLVLTEVVMPCLSGIGLLCKIMNHKTCKNVPVIMMSSHDSMNIVFKCLSKGAVDFLVKPIRKNELKKSLAACLEEMPQQKCKIFLLFAIYCSSFHQSSGSGSESGTRTQKSTKSKGADSDNNTGSNNEDEIGSVAWNARDGSDKGSGTQSSWTKRAVEVDSSLPKSTWDQVIHSRSEVLGNSWVPETTARECDRQGDERGMCRTENVVMGKDLEIGVPKITALQLENPSGKVNTNTTGANKEKLSEIYPNKDDGKLEKAQLELNNEKLGGDLIGVITNNTEARIESAVFDIPNGLPKVSDTKDKVVYGTKEIPSLELSLKRQRDVGDAGTSVHERNVLRHSDLSTFPRYNSGSTANQAPAGNVGSCSPFDNSSEAAKTDCMKNFQSNSNNMPPNQQSNGSSNNNDMGSTTNNAFSKPAVLSDEPAPKTSFKSFHPSSAFQPFQNGRASALQPQAQGKTDAALDKRILDKARGTDQQVQVQHHHHHYHHHHHHVHNMPQNQKLGNHDDLSMENVAAAARQCGSSNMTNAPHIEGNAGNRSLNGSASGSNHGSNGPNGNSTALNTRGLHLESENGVPGNGGAVGRIGFGGGNRVDQIGFAQREAALNKFRAKRKERCFEKKSYDVLNHLGLMENSIVPNSIAALQVRYQSRKKLAEQRPRIRGQFVRQVHENNNKDTNC